MDPTKAKINDFRGKDGFVCREGRLFLLKAGLRDIWQEKAVLTFGIDHLKDFVFPLLEEVVLGKYPQAGQIRVYLLSSTNNTPAEVVWSELLRQREEGDGTSPGKPYFDGFSVEHSPGSSELKLRRSDKGLHFIYLSGLDLNRPSPHSLPKVDVIFSCFELHYQQNWRVVLLNLLNALREGGAFVLSEIVGDFELLDGNFLQARYIEEQGAGVFQEHLPEFVEFLQELDAIRSREDFFWRPEISMSNYQPLRELLLPAFQESTDSQVWDVCPHEFGIGEFIDRWIRPGNLSYFRIGLRPDHPAYLKLVQEYEKKTFQVSLTKRVRLSVATGFRYFDLGPERCNYFHHPYYRWQRGELDLKLQSLHDEPFERLGTKALDLLITHDVFFPSHTVYLALVTWDVHRKYPIYLAFNAKLPQEVWKGEMHKMGRYMSLSPQNIPSLDDYVFQRLKRKFPIYFSIAEDFPQEPADRTSRFVACKVFGKQTQLQYLLQFDPKGNVQQMEIIFPRIFSDPKLREANFKSNQPSNFFDSLLISPGTAPADSRREWLYVEEKEVVRLKVGADLLDVLYEHYQVRSDLSPGDIELSSDGNGFQTLEGVLSMTRPGPGTPREELSRFLLSAYCFLALHEIAPGDRVAFFPPYSMVDGTEEKGSGGMVLVEKGTGRTLRPFPTDVLLAWRDDNLARAANQILFKSSLANYLRQDYLGQSLKAAVAAIISRNGSHGLGSHVLPAVSHSSHNPTDNQLLFTYVQQRLDFIAQVASEFPDWTFPAWFNSDLMMRFFMQRHLLNTLVRSEGLRAYEFPLDDMVEAPWPPSSEFSDLDENDKQLAVVLTGYVEDTAEWTDGQEELVVRVVHIHPDRKWNQKNNKAYYECFFPLTNMPRKKKQTFLRGLKVRVVGFLDSEAKGKNQLKGCRLLQHRLVVKVRRRLFLEFDDIQMKNGRIDLQASVAGSHSKEITRARDVGKKKNIEDAFAHKSSPDQRTIVYGVILDYDPGKNQLLLLSPFELPSDQHWPFEPEPLTEGFVCRLQEIPEPEKHPLLEMGKRILVEGVLREEGVYYLDHAKLRELVYIDYTVGDQLKAQPDDHLNLDLPVAIPGGVVGYQAFYTILENIIRNAAKHDWAKLPEEERFGRNLEVKIELEDKKGKEFIICKVWTTAGDLFHLGSSKNHFKFSDILQKESRKDVKKLEVGVRPLHHQLNNFLEEPIVELNGQLKKNNLGLAETRVAAGYLSQQTLQDIGGGPDHILLGSIDNQQEGFIKASAVWETDGRRLVPRLGFKFKLIKPREVVVLYWEPEAPRTIDTMESLRRPEHSVYVYSYQEVAGGQVFPDYDLCLLRADGEHANGRNMNNLLRDLFELREVTEPSTRDRTMQYLMSEIEYYPYRLLMVVDDVKEWVEAFREPELMFLRQRIVFLNKKTFDHLCSQEEEVPGFTLIDAFKLQIYAKWIRHYHFGSDKDRICYPIYFDLGLNNFKINQLQDNSIVTGTYQTFRNFIIRSVVKELSEKDRGIIRELESHLLRQNPEQEKYQGQYAFLQNWLGKEKYRTDFFDVLNRHFSDYKQIYIELFQKSFDEVETLPAVFRPPDGARIAPPRDRHFLNDNDWKDHFYPGLREQFFCPGDRKAIDLPDENWKKIGYIRHSMHEKGDYFYLDYLSGGQIFYSILKEYPYNRDNLYPFNKLILQLFENPFPKLMIIDERVQQYVNQNKYRTRLANVNIIVPLSVALISDGEKEEQLLQTPLPSEETDRDSDVAEMKIEISGRPVSKAPAKTVVIKFVNPTNTPPYGDSEPGNPFRYRISTLIIHHTLLGIMFRDHRSGEGNNAKGGQEQPESQVDEFIRKVKSAHMPSVIVTSGKGQPSDISRYAKFLPFSNIETFILQSHPEKFLLTQILLKTTKKRV
ncbi:MAG: hypothetical protein KDC32_17275 [Saprospiraceae bacterium]|nr:hypothetical protein [Saprospiraceae bacterium]MCB0682634.1 hypothetical protein [Saprospiraceae bacterium]